MADFNYKFGGDDRSISKFEELYKNKLNIVEHFDVFHNDNTITHISENEDSLTILGYVYKQGDDIKTYLADLLRDFNEERVVEAKKSLLGQYTVIIHKGDKLFVFSDFLQVRNIYYDTENRAVCSSFEVLHNFVKPEIDDYKIFEFLAMRHCFYPAWLSNTTLDSRIKKVRAFEYLQIDTNTGDICMKELHFEIDNTKMESLKQVNESVRTTLVNALQHPQLRTGRIYSTITGGFDSRLITALVKKYYPDTNLRIAICKGVPSRDYDIATRVAAALSSPLEVFETDIDKQKEWFYRTTDFLAPKENAIITELVQHTNRCDLGFGGALGTELLSSFDYNNTSEVVAEYAARARRFIKAEEQYYDRFEQSLHDEFKNIKAHYNLKNHNKKDFIRIFMLNNTASFSSTLISAFGIYGNQFEVFGTYPVIETALKIPYKYLGSKLTFGRFYMIPKALMERTNLKISKIDTTHFCPMRPLSIWSLSSYILGKIRMKRYYKQQAKCSCKQKPLCLSTDHIKYTSTEWFEGFMQGI